MADIWNDDVTVESLGIDVPRWIDQEITPYDVAGINQGGCSSGAYMPAVTNWQALETMNEYGDDILDYIENVWGELPQPTEDYQSWAGMACFYVSVAVELWASGVEEEIVEKLDEMAGDNE